MFLARRGYTQQADAWFRHSRVLDLAGRHRQPVESLECVPAHLPTAGGICNRCRRRRAWGKSRRKNS
ncbi:hypothetical protein [Kamptonema formosum]|uniref:hypothetical protein n=1 Tax=Kamptonema formosum TaxID=331992 RepID=UPI0018E268DF|nr:hypothetical protein [Oscillatoria sp. PCC 10802]